MGGFEVVEAPIKKAGEEVGGFFKGLFGHPAQAPGTSPAAPVEAPSTHSYQFVSPEELAQMKKWVANKNAITDLESKVIHTKGEQNDMLDSAMSDLKALGEAPPKDRLEYEKKLDSIEFKLAAAEGRLPTGRGRGFGSGSLKKLDSVSGKEIADALDYAGTPIDKSGGTMYDRFSDPYGQIVYLPARQGLTGGAFNDLMRAFDIAQHPKEHTAFEVDAANLKIAQARLQATPGQASHLVVGTGDQGQPTIIDVQTPTKGGGAPKVRTLGIDKPDKNVADAKKDLANVKLRLRDSESMGVKRTNPGDLILLENYMQLAFGQAPKGIRGSPAWFTQMESIVRGSLGERWAGEVNALQGRGLLSESARKQALDTIRTAAANRLASDQEIIDAASKTSGTVNPVNPPKVGGRSVEEELRAIEKATGQVH